MAAKASGGLFVDIINEMRLEFLGCAQNESFARVVISAFAVQLHPTIEEISDIKTAVSEAVTNAIIHGYEGTQGAVTLSATIDDQHVLTVEIQDHGKGIEDLEQAMQPFYTSHPELERSGMGFAVMRSFMDELEVTSTFGEGTSVRMRKRFAPIAK
jgi:stage II sporulation protein AB (anti-sigma F factor)